jgi:hypothetical protein
LYDSLRRILHPKSDEDDRMLCGYDGLGNPQWGSRKEYARLESMSASEFRATLEARDAEMVRREEMGNSEPVSLLEIFAGFEETRDAARLRRG